MTSNTLPEVINKIDAAAYNVTILELISVWKTLEREHIRLCSDKEYLEDLKEKKSPEFMAGYLHSNRDWKEGMGTEINAMWCTIFERMGIWNIVCMRPEIYREAVEEYANDEKDLDQLFSTLKKNIRELYVPSLKH
ncbi:hypothetical protein ABEX78_33455 [Priestia megaterium]